MSSLIKVTSFYIALSLALLTISVSCAGVIDISTPRHIQPSATADDVHGLQRPYYTFKGVFASGTGKAHIKKLQVSSRQACQDICDFTIGCNAYFSEQQGNDKFMCYLKKYVRGTSQKSGIEGGRVHPSSAGFLSPKCVHDETEAASTAESQSGYTDSEETCWNLCQHLNHAQSSNTCVQAAFNTNKKKCFIRSKANFLTHDGSGVMKTVILATVFGDDSYSKCIGF
eukprot:Nk52_evm13s1967 gene=Nk52_evmTU13s1967